MRKFLIICLVLLGALAISIGPLFLQDTPRVLTSAPPSAEDVATTRHLVHRIRATLQSSDPSAGTLQTDAAQLNSALRLGARFIRGFRGRVSVDADTVYGEISLPVPWWSGQKWLNLSGRVQEFNGPLSVRDVTVGATDIPPALAVSLVRVGANLGLGNRFGDRLLQAATAMAISGEDITFRLALDDMGKNGLMQGAFGALRGTEMPEPEEIEGYHRQIRAAMADGRLPQEGSFLPYIRFALEAAHENSTADGLPNAYTAAIFGLAKACGAREFAVIVGRLAFDVAAFSETWPTSCDAVTFNGRIDSRRHFITSAALQAASNRGFSVSVGEFKELFDTISGAGGFDFTDMAANLSGVRMSNVLMNTPHGAWPAALERIRAEEDVIVPFDGIPQLMPEAAFKVRFGTIESAAYKEMIAQIETRIDQLRLYRGG